MEQQVISENKSNSRQILPWQCASGSYRRDDQIVAGRVAAECLRGNEVPIGGVGVIRTDVKEAEGKEMAEPRSGYPW